MRFHEHAPPLYLYHTCLSFTIASRKPLIFFSLARRALRRSANRFAPVLFSRAAKHRSSASCSCGVHPTKIKRANTRTHMGKKIYIYTARMKVLMLFYPNFQPLVNLWPILRPKAKTSTEEIGTLLNRTTNFQHPNEVGRKDLPSSQVSSTPIGNNSHVPKSAMTLVDLYPRRANRKISFYSMMMCLSMTVTAVPEAVKRACSLHLRFISCAKIDLFSKAISEQKYITLQSVALVRRELCHAN